MLLCFVSIVCQLALILREERPAIPGKPFFKLHRSQVVCNFHLYCVPYLYVQNLMLVEFVLQSFHKVEKGVSTGHLKNCYYPNWHQVNVMDSSQAIHLVTNFLENRTPLFHKERHGNLGILK